MVTTQVRRKVCPICGNEVDGQHHIIPRSEGGDERQRNKVGLCNCCHDIVEEIYQEEGLGYSPMLVERIRRILGIDIPKIISNKPRWTNRIILDLVTKRFSQLTPTQIGKQLVHQDRPISRRGVKLLEPIRCKFCGIPFIPRRKQQVYCSKECLKLYYKLEYPLPLPRLCVYCGEEFTPRTKGKTYCSKKCARMAYYKRHSTLPPELKYQPRTCLYCGKEFMPYNSETGGVKVRFCSKRCCGRFYSNKHREKLHQAEKAFNDRLGEIVLSPLRLQFSYGEILFNPLTLRFTYNEQGSNLVAVK